MLDVPRGLHEQDGGLTVVCLDEFQDLLVADDSLDGLFRSVIQHHAGAGAYVFAGSQPSLMRALFSDRERPFYAQARPLELPVLPADEAARDIEALLTADGPEPVWDSLGRTERIVLLALADGQAPTGSTVAAEHRIARSTLQDALERLVADERNVRRDEHGRPYALDPLLGEWLRRR